jgi:UTP--glucose-1-phosphate uridylyltransferase
VEELVDAGVEHVVFVVGARSQAIEQYFHVIPELDNALDGRGRGRSSDPVWAKLMECSFSYVRQDTPAGIAEAVYCARHLVGNEPYFVHMGDSIIYGDRGVLRRMVEAHVATGVSETLAVGWHVPHALGTHVTVAPSRSPANRTEAFPVGRMYHTENRGPDGGPYAAGRFLLEGPMVLRPGSHGQRYGGLSGLLEAGEGCSVTAVPLLDTEIVLGAGSIDEYLESWRLLSLDG